VHRKWGTAAQGRSKVVRAALIGCVCQAPCVVMGLLQGHGMTQSKTTLTISSHNYSSWSLRGWLLAKLSGLEFETVAVPVDDAAARAELLLLSPSILVPCLSHDGIKVWDTLAITEYLNEICPDAQLLPAERKARAHCRAICGEMHSGFSALRAALPMNLRAHFPNFKIWSRAQDDIERILEIWRECFANYGGPYLFGKLSAADAMYAPVVTRFLTYDVKLDKDIAEYCKRILALPHMVEWIRIAQSETEDIDELDVEF
jgi:glutathione S-transferase